MIWIYILKCEDNIYYVGKTCRLFKRFWEHERDGKTVNTSFYPVKQILTIYNSKKIGDFIKYLHCLENNNYNLGYNIYFDRGGILETFNDTEEENNYIVENIENYMVEKLMHDNKNYWQNIRGGKYVRFDCKYKFPSQNVLSEIPNCNCHLMCDVRLDKNNNFYFVCSKKNIWHGLKNIFDIYTKPCNYYQKFTKDTEFKKNYFKRKEKINKLKNTFWVYNIPTSIYETCIGGCGKTYDENYTLRINRKSVNLCFDCLLDKTIELEEKYDNKLKECVL